MDKLRKALDSVRAEEELKAHTAEFIRQELQKRQRHQPHRLRYALCTLAVLLLTLCGTGGYVVYQMPVSYISIDINPSMELALNCFDRVVSVDAYNDDGQRILQSVSLNDTFYLAAIDRLLADEAMTDYLDTDAQLSFTIVSDREMQLMEGIQSCRYYADYNSKCYSAEETLLEPAHRCNMSVGKYKACQELAEQDDTLTFDMCKKMSMREIRQRLQDIAETGSACETSAESETDICPDDDASGPNSTFSGMGYGCGTGEGYGAGNGSGTGKGYGTGNGSGNGKGQGSGHGHGNGHGNNGNTD